MQGLDATKSAKGCSSDLDASPVDCVYLDRDSKQAYPRSLPEID